MSSLLNLDRNLNASTDRPASQPEKVEPASETSKPIASTLEQPGEFEIVLGRRQIASTSLVVIVLVAVLSAFSYLIGKSMTAKAGAAAPTIPASTVPAPVAEVPVLQAPAVQASAQEPAPALSKTAEVAATSVTAAPLFGEEVPGKVYIQLGAVPKGLGAIWAEGLRTHGFEAFVAPGPSDVSWRVVIGPLPDPQSFERTKKALDALGLDTFGRRHEP